MASSLKSSVSSVAMLAFSTFALGSTALPLAGLSAEA